MTQHPIAAFLHARWDELEQKARAAGDKHGTEWDSDGEYLHVLDMGGDRFIAVNAWGGLTGPLGAHLAAHDPAYVLADIAGKRQILMQIFAYEAKIDGEWGCCHSAEEIAAGQCPDINPDEIPALRALALPFTRHPEHQESWKP